jgi:hypothetical protein
MNDWHGDWASLFPRQTYHRSHPRKQPHTQRTGALRHAAEEGRKCMSKTTR